MSEPEKPGGGRWSWSGPGLGARPKLGGLGVLGEKASEVLDGIASEFRGLVDLPGDVYRVVTQVPDEKRIRVVLDKSGTSLLTALVPVARSVARGADMLPLGPWLQPVLFGKLFALDDYVEDRRAALAALPDLPRELEGEVQDLATFVRHHRASVARALEVLPEAEDLEALSSSAGWRAFAEGELAETFGAVDGRYAAFVRDPKRLERERPVFRAVYALTYAAAARADPLSAWLRRQVPGSVRTFDKLRSRRDRFERALTRLDELGLRPTESGPATAAREGLPAFGATETLDVEPEPPRSPAPARPLPPTARPVEPAGGELPHRPETPAARPSAGLLRAGALPSAGARLPRPGALPSAGVRLPRVLPSAGVRLPPPASAGVRLPRAGALPSAGARLPRPSALPSAGVRLPRPGTLPSAGVRLPRPGALPSAGVRLPGPGALPSAGLRLPRPGALPRLRGSGAGGPVEGS